MEDKDITKEIAEKVNEVLESVKEMDYDQQVIVLDVAHKITTDLINTIRCRSKSY